MARIFYFILPPLRSGTTTKEKGQKSRILKYPATAKKFRHHYGFNRSTAGDFINNFRCWWSFARN